MCLLADAAADAEEDAEEEVCPTAVPAAPEKMADSTPPPKL